MTLGDLDYRDPTFIKITIGVVLGLIIGVVWYTQSYTVNKKTIVEKRNNLEQLRSKLNEAKIKARSLEELQKELNVLFTKYKLLEELLPEDRDIPDFLNKLYIAAKDNGILLQKITPNPSKQKDFYYEDPYTIQLACNYHKFGAFLADIANFPFTAISRDIDITGGGKTLSINVVLSLSTFHLPTSERLKSPEQLR